jgi:hypothetical protein
MTLVVGPGRTASMNSRNFRLRERSEMRSVSPMGG